MNKKIEHLKYFRKSRDFGTDFEAEVMAKVHDNFMNEDFFNKLLMVINSKETCEEETSLFDSVLSFARECYIHGVTTGISAAIEIYQNS